MKKGSGQDILFTAVACVAFAIMVIIAAKMVSEINTKVQGSDLIDSYGKTSSTQLNNLYSGVIDNSFLFLMVGLALVAFVLAAMVRIHPIFLAPYLFLLLIITFLAGVFSNIYQEIAAKPQMASVAATLTNITLIMNSLPFIVGVFGGLLAIVMYKNWKSAQFG